MFKQEVAIKINSEIVCCIIAEILQRRIMFEILAVLSILSSCEGAIGYVKPKDYTSPCPGVPCESIEHYAVNTSILTFNYTLLFLPGVHNLAFNLVVTNVSFLNLMATHLSGHESVVIRCMESAGLVFKNVQWLKLTDLTILYCSSDYGSDDSQSALRIETTVNLVIQNVHVHNSSGYGILAKNVFGNFIIRDCSFLYNGGSDTYNGGNAFIDYSNVTEGYYDNKTSLQILSSNFSYGNINLNKTFDNLNKTFATGLTIMLSYTNIHIYINNITLKENKNSLSAGIGGNMFLHYFNKSSFLSNSVYINGSRFIGGRSQLGSGLAVTFYTDQQDSLQLACDNTLTITNSVY